MRALAVHRRKHGTCVPMVVVELNTLGTFQVVAVGRTARDAIATPQTVQVNDGHGITNRAYAS